ncbi:histidine kinase [bacterium SCSIO 12643]|nr:histidine kinase [bacterium SCSIO 12643]
MSAQILPVKHFGQEDGLSDEKCYDILQDSNGFIWLATNSGIIKYDGIEFKNFPFPQDTEEDAYRIVPYKDYFIITSADHGFYLLKNDSLFQPEYFTQLHKSKSKHRFTKREFTQDTYQNLWLTYHAQDTSIFKFTQITSNNQIQQIYIPADQNEIGYAKVFVNENIQFSSCQPQNKDGHNFTLIIEDQRTDTTFYVDLPNPQVIYDVKCNSKNLFAISQVRKLIFTNGLTTKVIDTKEFIQVDGLYFENDSTIWCAFRNAPTLRFIINNLKTLDYSITEYPELINITNYYLSKNQLWLTSGTLGFYQIASNNIQQIRTNTLVTDFTFFQDQLIYGDQHRIFKHHTTTPPDTILKVSSTIKKLYSTSQNIILSTNSSKIKINHPFIYHILFQGNREHFINYDSTLVFSKRTASRYHKTKDNILKTTSFGDYDQFVQINRNLFYALKGNELLQIFASNDSINNMDILAQDVYKIYTAQNGRVFYTTLNGDLYEIFEDQTLTLIIEQHPLFKGQIKQVVPYKDFLFFLLGNGMIRYDQKNQRHPLQYYFGSSKLYKGPFQKLKIHKDTLYWLADGQIFYSNNPFEKSSLPQFNTYLTENGSERKKESSIDKTFYENSILLHSSSFNYSKKPYIRQMMKIVSDRNEIVSPVYQNKIFLPDLDPGAHTILTYHQNIITSETSAPSKIVISIERPFWKEWWFWLIIACATIGPLVVFIRHRNIAKIEKLTLTHQLNQLHSQAISSQLNPHFIFNALGSIQFLINDEKTEKADDYLSTFAQLLRSVLENSTHDWYSFSKERKVLELYLSLENLRFKKDNKIEFVYGSGITEEHIMIPPLLLQVIVENSIIHGLQPLEQDGVIRIEIHNYDQGMIQISVLDNGIGFGNTPSQSKNKKSLGLAMIAERLEVISKMENTTCHMTYGIVDHPNTFNSFVKMTIPKKLSHE